jgi:hypothetical protein
MTDQWGELACRGRMDGRRLTAPPVGGSIPPCGSGGEGLGRPHRRCGKSTVFGQPPNSEGIGGPVLLSSAFGAGGPVGQTEATEWQLTQLAQAVEAAGQAPKAPSA